MNYCPNCGTKLEANVKFCSSCGRALTQTQEPPKFPPQSPVSSSNNIVQEVRSPTITIERSEPTYYADTKGVRITSTRLIITKEKSSSTYAMANISSVKTGVIPAKRTPGIIFAVIGLIAVIIGAIQGAHGIGNAVIIIGAIILILGLLFAILPKPIYTLKITSTSTEEEPLKDKDKNYIGQVVRAVNEAITKRG